MNNDDSEKGLPSGHLTFVFTDIEGSTRLYKALGDELAGDVFELHNELLRAAWDDHRGFEVHTEGDSFFVVFEDPEDAIAACLDAQRRIASASWPPGGEVRVRIGIHCGLAAPRHGDYMALAVHQAARVMSAANGGQILATESVVDRVDRADGWTVTEAGMFRLRDFDAAPVLYRIDGDGATNERPPRAVPASRHNLVRRLNSFVGRESDLVAVNASLESGRAVTVVGPGGIGKTRLATEVGLDVAPSWPAGVWMVEFAAILDPELIAEQIALTIGIDTTGAGDRWHDVTSFIGDKAMLLVLDNVEHLIDDVAGLVPDLLRACPRCAVLVTSREPLNCAGELVYRLSPLGLSPDDDDGASRPSVQLFIDRAEAVATAVEWSDEALDHVVDICARLDGLPLAIEIAAAQVAVLQLPEIRSGLNNRFRLLRSRDRALPARQRTMEGLLGWSYQLLDEHEQRAFRRLAVFAGSFSIDAAEAALAGDGVEADDVPELIWSLVDKSLIAADLTESATRYRLFESVQQYALRLLIDTDDPVRSAVALAHWLLDRVAPWHVNDRRWLGEVAIESANIRNVVDLIADAEPEIAQQLMCSMGRLHDTQQSYTAGIDELTRASHVLTAATSSRVALLADTAHLHLRMGRTEQAVALITEADELQRTVGPPAWNDVAIERLRGELAVRAGDFGRAIDVARSALARNISDQGRARMWSIIGIAEASRDDLDAGLSALETALDVYKRLGDAPHLALAHANVAEAAWRRGLCARAAKHQRYCLEDAIVIGQRLAISTSLFMAGYLADNLGSWHDAIRLHAKADSMLRQAGHEPYEEVVLAVGRTRDRAVAELGSSAVADATARGREMTVLDAARLAFDTFDLEIDEPASVPSRS